MDKEVWKKIPNYENYEISNLGRVRRNNKILKLYFNNKGYLYASLSKYNKKKSIRVNRLVAQSFIPNPDNLPEVNHKDENKFNNYVGNLEWCNHLYNVRYGKGQEKATEKRCKKIGQYDLKNEIIKIWNSIKEAESYYKNSHIRDVLKNRRKTASGYIWRYI